jgi:hypothetical protein
VLLRWFPLARGLPGEAGDGANLKPGFLFFALDLFSAPSDSLASFLFSEKENRLNTSSCCEGCVAGCATGSARPLSAHQNGGGLQSLYTMPGPLFLS